MMNSDSTTNLVCKEIDALFTATEQSFSDLKSSVRNCIIVIGVIQAAMIIAAILLL